MSESVKTLDQFKAELKSELRSELQSELSQELNALRQQMAKLEAGCGMFKGLSSAKAKKIVDWCHFHNNMGMKE